MSVTSKDSMRASFPTRPVPIVGEPTLPELLRILNWLIECGRSHRTAGQPLGKLYLVINHVLYPMYTAQAYPNRAPNPGDTPFYAPNSGSTARANVNNTFALQYKLYHEELHMDEALIEAFYDVLEQDYAADLPSVIHMSWRVMH